MDTIASRLRAAIERWGSIRRFADAMPKVRGATYGMIHRYLKGETDPPLEFLEAAAGVLGVRVEWLAHGKEPMTAREERVSELERDRVGADLLENAAIARGFTPGTRALLFDAWRRLAAGVPQQDIPERDLIVMAAQLLALLDLPTQLWGFKHEMPERELNDYAVAMLSALMRAMPESGAGDMPDERGVLYAHGFRLEYADDHIERARALLDARVAAHEDRVRETEARLARLDELMEAFKAGQISAEDRRELDHLLDTSPEEASNGEA